jgi:hypothetical protein
MRAREFLSENNVNSTKYIEPINTLLASETQINLPLQPSGKGPIIDFYPNLGQQISKLSDTITGTTNGETKTIKAGSIFKSNEIKNLSKGKPVTTVKINRGELIEGYHAAAAFARLIKRPDANIDIDDIINIINQLSNGQTLVLPNVSEIVNTQLADRFELTIKLTPNTWADFKNIETIKHMGGMIDSVISDANSETSKYAHRFATNELYDIARVIGDGVTDQNSSKTDVSFENQREKKFKGYSLKTLTKQVHQVGGGAVSDSRKSKKATPEERFDILSNKLFAVDNKQPLANIESVRPQFLAATSIEEMQKIAYGAATQDLNNSLKLNPKEFLPIFVDYLKFWIRRDNPNIQVKQFTNKETFIFDPELIDRVLTNKQVILTAEYSLVENLPRIIIKDTVGGKSLVTIRTKKENKENGVYLRNLIEKEPLWSELIMVKQTPNKKPVSAPILSAPTATTPVQDTSTPGIRNQDRTMQGSKELMGQQQGVQ